MSNKRRMSIHESDSDSDIEKPMKKNQRISYNLRSRTNTVNSSLNESKEPYEETPKDSLSEDTEEVEESSTEESSNGDTEESSTEESSTEESSTEESSNGDTEEVEENEENEENDIEDLYDTDETLNELNLVKLDEIERKVKNEIYKKSPNSALEFHKVINHIHNSRIDIIDVLNTPMTIDDKALIYQMFEVLHMIPKFTQEYIEYHNILSREIKRAKQKYEDFKALSEENQSKYLENKTRLLTSALGVPLDYKIVTLNADDKIKAYIYKEYTRMSQMSMVDEEKPKLERWIETCLNLPFKRYKEIPDNRSQFLKNMKECLDNSMYGLTSVKEQLLVFANARLSNPEMKDCTLGLVGPAGIGKTMIARLLSQCLTLPFAQISCGGITDSDVLRGHSYTYIGSKCGEIAKTVSEIGYNNGVILFDEFEKISSKSSITGMLLHVLDPLQNSHFQDSYLGRDIPIDLSKMWFVLSMNELPEDNALRDRIFAIHLTDYTKDEKFEIAKRHLIPRHIQNLKIDPVHITFSDDSIKYLVEHHSKSGIRNLNQLLREILTKISFLQQTNIPMSFTINNMTIPYRIEKDIIDKILPKKENKEYLNMFL